VDVDGVKIPYVSSGVNSPSPQSSPHRGEEIIRIAQSSSSRGEEVKRRIKISWFVYVVRLNDSYTQEDRDRILGKLKKRGIGCSNYFTPIHLQPFYREMFGYKEGDFPITEKVSKSTIALPFYNNLTEEEIDYVCRSLKGILSIV